MKNVLLLAGAYNLVWGGFAILFPMTIFRWAGAEPLPAYPELWQCIGMIVGVYGIGYVIASRAPYVHWPIVLVGLLGKVFGPIGFLLSLQSGRLPLEFAWTLLTNDLVWWVPFTLILWQAARFHQSKSEQFIVPAPVRRIDPLGRMVSQRGATLTELSRHNPVLVVFLRHSGCTFCREAVSDIAEQREQIEANGTQIAFVHMGQAEPTELLEKYGVTDLHCFRDPSCSLYDAFGLTLGSFRQLLGPAVWYRGFRSWLSGHSAGALDGNVFRMPGVFLMDDGEVVRSYIHKSAADRPDYVSLSTLPETAGSESESPNETAIV